MSTATQTPPGSSHEAKRRVPYSRLIRVELRKMLDTRAGLWLLIITGGLIVLAMALTLLVLAIDDNATASAQGFSEIMTIPLSLLLPVFAIVTVTSEWSQRSHLVTFTLEPHRGRIFGAKFIAVLIFALATLVLAIILGIVGNLLYGVITGNEVVWNVDASDLAWTVGLQLAYFAMAFAFGMALLSTPGTIAVFYIVALLLPLIVYPTLMFMFDWARDLIPFLDFNIAAIPLMTETDFVGDPVDVGALQYLQLASSLILLVVIPAVVGWFRVLRSEVK